MLARHGPIGVGYGAIPTIHCAPSVSPIVTKYEDGEVYINGVLAADFRADMRIVIFCKYDTGSWKALISSKVLPWHSR